MLQLKDKRKGVEGLSRPFKEMLMEDELKEGAQIAYYGRPALCVPYIMVKSYEIRNLPVQQVFVPLLDESKAKVIKFVPDVGMQVSEETTEVHPQVVVLMGESCFQVQTKDSRGMLYERTIRCEMAGRYPF
jgi:hypothetical protein